MWRFKSTVHLQRFATVHGAVQNLTYPWHNAGFCVRVVTSKDHQANARSYPVRVANGSLEIEV